MPAKKEWQAKDEAKKDGSKFKFHAERGRAFGEIQPKKRCLLPPIFHKNGAKKSPGHPFLTFVKTPSQPVVSPLNDLIFQLFPHPFPFKK